MVYFFSRLLSSASIAFFFSSEEEDAGSLFSLSSLSLNLYNRSSFLSGFKFNRRMVIVVRNEDVSSLCTEPPAAFEDDEDVVVPARDRVVVSGLIGSIAEDALFCEAWASLTAVFEDAVVFQEGRSFRTLRT